MSISIENVSHTACPRTLEQRTTFVAITMFKWLLKIKIQRQKIMCKHTRACVNYIYIYIYIQRERERERESIPFFDLVKLTSLVTKVMKLSYYEGKRVKEKMYSVPGCRKARGSSLKQPDHLKPLCPDNFVTLQRVRLHCLYTCLNLFESIGTLNW